MTKSKSNWYERLSVSMVKALMIGGMIAGLINENIIGFLVGASVYGLLDYFQNYNKF